MRLIEIVFGVPLLVGVVLVVCSALGASELSADGELCGDGLDEAGDGCEGDGLLGVLGVGRVPLVIVTMLLLLLFGGAGLALMGPLGGWLGERAALLIGMPLAFLIALAGTALGTRLLARVLPATESYASHRDELVGLRGTVVVALSAGEVIARVRDLGGAELRVCCLLREEGVRPGEQLELLAYEDDRDRYLAQLC